MIFSNKGSNRSCYLHMARNRSGILIASLYFSDGNCHATHRINEPSFEGIDLINNLTPYIISIDCCIWHHAVCAFSNDFDGKSIGVSSDILARNQDHLFLLVAAYV